MRTDDAADLFKVELYVSRAALEAASRHRCRGEVLADLVRHGHCRACSHCNDNKKD